MYYMPQDTGYKKIDKPQLLTSRSSQSNCQESHINKQLQANVVSIAIQMLKRHGERRL